MSEETRHPEVEVHLSCGSGNAFVIIGTVSAALRKAGVPPDEIQAFRKEAQSGDYDNVLRTCMRWVTVL